jgi:hypothetical protein
MNRLTEILKRHIWCVIAIAAIILLAIITESFSKDVNLVSHLSLASAIVSIVLAVIVIVYMYFQDQRSSQNITEMRKLIDEGHRTMTDKAGLMIDKAQSIENIARLMQSPSPGSKPDTPPLEILERLKLDVSVYSRSGLLVLYSLAKSHELRKTMSWNVISRLLYKENESWAIQVQVHGLGIIQSFEAFLRHEYLTSSNEQIRVKKLPDGFAESVIAELNHRIKDKSDNFSKNGMVVIDNYFDNL